MKEVSDIATIDTSKPVEGDKRRCPTPQQQEGVKRFSILPGKEVPWPTKVFCCVGWAVDKLITVLLVLLWPLIFLCTWTTGCYLDVRTRTWKEMCTDSLTRPQYMDVDDWIFLVMLTLVVDVVGAGALFLLCAAACWLWQYKIALAIGACVLLVTAFFWFCHGVYKLLKED